MILGVFINGYKSYNKAFYIPIAEGVEDKYSTYIGDNGVGKSAIFEALDVFFNDRGWNVSTGATRSEIYISVVFLINKKEFEARILDSRYYNDIEGNKSTLEQIKKISEYIYTKFDNAVQGVVRRNHIARFLDTLNNIKKNGVESEYYILVLGLEHTGKATFKPLAKYISKELFNEEENVEITTLNSIKELILDYYAYLYIPVEQNVDEILKVEARQMQILMNKDVLEEIDKVLETKVTIGGRDRSILKFLNEHLNYFMENVNKSIQTIDDLYGYNTQAFTKKNLTAADIRDKILEAYFRKRTLKYNNREIYELSSGEQRKALIDIAYAFLSNNEQKDKKIILAIDEPEVSLNVANCFAQFERLERLANDYNNQVLLTTHWYGFLPISKQGNLYYLERENNSLEVKEFTFFNYLTESRTFPDNVELKSMFDLSVSILNYIRSNPSCKWIVCEGSSDRIYLETIMQNQNYRILPVGGCGRVINLYNLLIGPFNIEKEKKNTGNSVLCLIDTDEIKMNLQGIVPKKSSIQIRRLQIDEMFDKQTKTKKYNIELINPASDGKLYCKTEIEDCLIPKIYYKAVKNVIVQESNKEIENIFNMFIYNIQAVTSVIQGDNSILLPRCPKAYGEKYKIIDFLSRRDIKFKVAVEYCTLYKEGLEENNEEHKLLSIINKIFLE